MTDPSATLIELGAVILGLAVIARTAGRLRIPTIPFYLVAGLAFGRGGIIPLDTTSEFIQLGGEIGLVLLLLSLGLEYSARELITTLRQQAPAGLVDAALNFPPGFIAGLVLGWPPVAAAALGGVTFVSSSGIIAKLIHDAGTNDPEHRLVVSMLVLEDLAMAVFLPVLAGFLIADGLTVEGAATSAGAVAAVVLLLALALRIDVGISRFLFRATDEALLFTILGVTILVAGLAEKIQVSAAVGALLVGIVMSGPATEGAHELLTPLRNFFAALFFVFFGLGIDAGALGSAIGPAAVLAIVTAATKFATGWLVARRAGFDRDVRIRMGALLIARGEFSIVIIAIAAASDVRFDASIGAAYVLLLAIAGPIVARFVDRRVSRSTTPAA